MLRDKKNFGGKSRFILLKDLAQAEVVENIEIEILKETFDKVLA
jgi:3-dehydroquinate synthetase